jgi:hypothetical protein
VAVGDRISLWDQTLILTQAADGSWNLTEGDAPSLDDTWLQSVSWPVLGGSWVDVGSTSRSKL